MQEKYGFLITILVWIINSYIVQNQTSNY